MPRLDLADLATRRDLMAKESAEKDAKGKPKDGEKPAGKKGFVLHDNPKSKKD